MRIGDKNKETAIIVLGAFKDAIRKTGQINVRKENEEETMEYIDMAIEALKSQPKIGEWIPCSERLPENEKEVEITFVRKHYKTGETLYLTARAFHEDGTLTTDDSIFLWEEGADWEYVEEKDGYIIPEGWFEGVSFTENFGIVDMTVIAWRPLPEAYRIQSNQSVEQERSEVG